MNLYGNGLVSAGGETLLYDGLGAVRQTTGSSSPAVQWSGSYQAYGVASSTSGSTGSHSQWGAGSGYRSDGFGPTYAAPLQKVGARYYDPEFGCFLTRDTDLSQMPYLYCDSDPINCTDPDGHKGIKIVFDPVKLSVSNGVTLSVSFHSGTSFSGTSTLSGIVNGMPNFNTTTKTNLFGGTLTTSFNTGQGATSFSGSYFHTIYGPIGFMDTFGTGQQNRAFISIFNRYINL